MRVVIDANVFVSFLLTKGQTISAIFESWKEKKFQILVNDEIVTELKQVLSYFVLEGLIERKNTESLLKRIKKEAEIVAPISAIRILRDRKDNRYLACAKDGKADYLVTGDKKHLLPLKKFEKTRIISPKEFAKLIGSEVAS